MPSFSSCFDCCPHCIFGRCIGYPHITFTVDMHSMRPNKHLGPKALNDVAFRVELVDGVVRFEFTVRIHAVEAEPTSSRSRYRVRLIAPDESPDTLSINVDVDGSGWTHLSSTWKPCPLTSWNTWAASVCKALDRTVRVISRSLCEVHRSSDE